MVLRDRAVEVSGVQWATEMAVVEAVLGRRPGVVSVDANPVAQTATVTFERLARNGAVTADEVSFVPPAGVDVIGAPTG